MCPVTMPFPSSTCAPYGDVGDATSVAMQFAWSANKRVPCVGRSNQLDVPSSDDYVGGVAAVLESREGLELSKVGLEGRVLVKDWIHLLVVRQGHIGVEEEWCGLAVGSRRLVRDEEFRCLAFLEAARRGKFGRDEVDSQIDRVLASKKTLGKRFR
jgi:hypothetical protein